MRNDTARKAAAVEDGEGPGVLCSDAYLCHPLRRAIMAAGARAQYERAMLEAFELEDVIKCRANKDYTPR